MRIRAAEKTFTVFIALMVMVPIAVVLLSFLFPAKDIWEYLLETVMSDLLLNTSVLVIGLTIVTSILGVSLAWLTSVCDYPGRKFFRWALLLPLAMPTYVLAFVSLGIFDFSGPVQTFLREYLPNSSLGTVNLRTHYGVIAVMSLALYPYVYLITYNAFKTQGARALEVAQSLGYGKFKAFFKICIPMARPWIAGGLLLVIMEALADFGAVSIFNYDTFTTAIYKAWFGFFSINAAAQLSSILVLIVLILVLLEKASRKRKKFWHSSKQGTKTQLLRLNRYQSCLASIYCSVVLVFAFILPVIQLLYWTYEILSLEFDPSYFDYIKNSLGLSLIATIVVAVSALLLAYVKRHSRDIFSKFLITVSTLGYALPGTILSVGIVLPAAFIDKLINAIFVDYIGLESVVVLQGSLGLLILAYLVRFMAPAFNAIDSAMHRVNISIDRACSTFALSNFQVLSKVHAPILKGGITIAMMLVFVDVMKEMPITLIMRPFGWSTLAVRIYEMTSEGEWARAALPAICLIISGIIPIVIMSKHMGDSDE